MTNLSEPTLTPEQLVILVPGPEVRLVTVCDPHLCPATPPAWKADMWETTKDAFRQVIRFAEKVQAHGILIAGDLLHLKTPTRNPPWFINEVLQLLNEAKVAGIGVWAIAGNHDLSYGSLVSLYNQPFGTLVLSKALHLLDGQPVILQAEGFSVKVAGCSYQHGSHEPTKNLKKEGNQYLVGLGHFWFGDTGNFFGEPRWGPDVLSQSEVDAYVIGHHHVDQGILKSPTGHMFFVHGSMSRTGTHKDDLTRRPAVGLMTISKDGIRGQTCRLRVKPAEELFDLNKRDQLRKGEEELDAFVQMLSTGGMSTTDPYRIVEEIVLDEDVRKRVRLYLDMAEEALAKERL